MTMTYEHYKRITNEHISEVRKLLLRACQILVNLAQTHDYSKLTSPEKELFMEHISALENLTYDSKEYRDILKKLDLALENHYSVSTHHPEHFRDGIRGMDLFDLIEMICDWAASTLRHKDGNIQRSIRVNQRRFGYTNELKQIFENTVKVLEVK